MCNNLVSILRPINRSKTDGVTKTFLFKLKTRFTIEMYVLRQFSYVSIYSTVLTNPPLPYTGALKNRLSIKNYKESVFLRCIKLRIN